MFIYEKKLQYPVNIKTPNPKLAALIISQYGGPYSNKLQNITSPENRRRDIFLFIGDSVSCPKPERPFTSDRVFFDCLPRDHALSRMQHEVLRKRPSGFVNAWD